MDDIIKDRVLQEAQCLVVDSNYSVRKLAKKFQISKSQVHRDLHLLSDVDSDMYAQVNDILVKHRKGY